MLTSLEHVQIPVKQMDRAIAWYSEQLGFQLSSKDGDRIAFLNLPEGPYLMLWQTSDEATNAQFTVNGTEFPVSLYRTTRIHELHKNLTSIGTPIQVYQDDGFGWVLKFYDPEGNLWGALQFNESDKN
ncbi:catechol 2,3-dioxygenase-like lactoylglutathione lyase family enzyme [Paenibacillus taihuensis]|uniref:Catechol 2,3-dioxygenase-like lactoylglutathione lyase family enzyme n=1 Tax=Paenibacillus taihuensis TaxID=1156355 RepID=A0A3D9Q607_9BACL|nr:VOC family protein [Paenibacillus taihuensis]REE55367.1 catechol 2,3-dioxygenase-like lactoylglutathione lyase family enzyme [Paenibacillus taihuensis]